MKMLLEPYLATEKLFLLLCIDYLLPKEQFQWVVQFSKLHPTQFIEHNSPTIYGQIWIFEAKNNRKMLFEPYLATEKLLLLL